MISERKLETLLWRAGCRSRGRFDGGSGSEEMFAAALFRIGASHVSAFGGEGAYYGLSGPPVPPRDDGGALPGLGSACLPWIPGDKSREEALYVLASQAWMHANCDQGPNRYLWLMILEACREGRVPTEELRKVKWKEGEYGP